MDIWLPGMARDAVPVAVFPTAGMKGVVVSASVLRQALREELLRMESVSRACLASGDGDVLRFNQPTRPRAAENGVMPQMTNDWDFYALLVDDEPASIFVDLGIQSKAPLDSHPNLAYIRLTMNRPRPNGLSSQEEFDALIEVEKQIEAILCGEEVAYVGRNTASGFRDFYFYTADLPDWQSMVDSALSRFPIYKYEAGARHDATWSTYFDFLLPGKVDRQRIENRRVCEQLEQHGDALTKQREIDHWCFFPTQEPVDEFLNDAVVLGLQLRSMLRPEQGGLTFGAQVWREDVPSYFNIDEISLPLVEAAERHGGEYDGWESPIEA